MINDLKEIFKYRQMIVSMVRKELRGRYKGSVLGFMWTFINPLLQLLVYNMVFSIILRNNIEKFYLYLFVALIPWMFFSASITGGSVSILSQKDLIKKIYFPREIIPVSYVTSSFVNMLLCFIVVIAVALISGVVPTVTGIICLPVIMIVEYMMGLGVALIVSALTVYLRDLEHILSILAMVWMYATPVIYSGSTLSPKLYSVMMLNPMAPIIELLRYGWLGSGTTPLLYWGVSWITTAVVLFIGIIIFNKVEKTFMDTV